MCFSYLQGLNFGSLVTSILKEKYKIYSLNTFSDDKNEVANLKKFFFFNDKQSAIIRGMSIHGFKGYESPGLFYR